MGNVRIYQLGLRTGDRTSSVCSSTVRQCTTSQYVSVGVVLARFRFNYHSFVTVCTTYVLFVASLHRPTVFTILFTESSPSGYQFAHGVMGCRIDPPLSYFSYQPVLHDWYNKSRGMYYPACGMMHIKEPLLLIGTSILCGGNGFPLSLTEWSFTICVTPYNRK